MVNPILIAILWICISATAFGQDSRSFHVKGFGSLWVEVQQVDGHDLLRGTARDEAGAPVAHEPLLVASIGEPGEWLVSTQADGQFTFQENTHPNRTGWKARFSPSSNFVGESSPFMMRRFSQFAASSREGSPWTLKGRLTGTPGNSETVTLLFPGNVKESAPVQTNGLFSWTGFPAWVAPEGGTMVYAQLNNLTRSILVQSKCAPFLDDLIRVEAGVSGNVRCIPEGARSLHFKHLDREVELSPFGGFFVPVSKEAEINALEWHWDKAQLFASPGGFVDTLPGADQIISPLWGLLAAIPLLFFLIGEKRQKDNLPSRVRHVRPPPNRPMSCFEVLGEVTQSTIQNAWVHGQSGTALKRDSNGFHYTLDEFPLQITANGYLPMTLHAPPGRFVGVTTKRQQHLKEFLMEQKQPTLSLRIASRTNPRSWRNVDPKEVVTLEALLFGPEEGSSDGRTV